MRDDPDVIEVLTNSTMFLVNTATEYKELCFPQYQWSFRSGLRYCFALISTVGYGDYTPRTAAGQIFTLFYMIIGMFYQISVKESIKLLFYFKVFRHFYWQRYCQQ